MIDFSQARGAMIDGQLRPQRIIDPALLDAMAQLPREQFVPKNQARLAYADRDIPISRNRSMLSPLKTAHLIQALELTPASLVLDVGCGMGYTSAVLTRLAGAVIAVEPEKSLRTHAEGALQEFACDNVAVFKASLKAGYPEQAPYDGILLAGGCAQIPKTLTDQLAVGGRLATILCGQDGSCLRVYRKTAHNLDPFDVWETHAPFMPGLEPRQTFAL
ncbi:MAG: protein-L-isoaspartate O-methyltransferase [Pseudomonadota bacterium]